ncbi:unnamed protein product [Cylicocyclus nassatus]|uniref:Uncharacterized protein n=1 Tax=Cylicocyclus nassatus TaxID=53992 RepID=A0AA36H729_CYLNA|nr:unnamed protein product [Cylicocyclus nassatus]
MAMLIAVKKKDIASAFRTIFVAATILISHPVLENVRSFNEYVSCDQFVTKSVAYAESIVLVMDFVSFLFDVYDAESLMFFIYCDSEDYKIYDDSF